jgi:hypothetical protein
MSVHPTTHRSILRGLVAAGTAVVATLAFTGSAAATYGPAPTKVAGNPNCASLGLSEVKIDPVPQGRTSRSGFTISVSGLRFDWTSAQGVDAVIVKGGPNANVYRYQGEATRGWHLSAPVNPNNGQPYGLSHISFCFDADSPTPPPPPTPSCPEGQTMNSAGQCVTPPKPGCPSGQTMDSQGKCVTPPKPGCPSGQTMNSAGECVTPPKPGCPEGQTMNAAGECVPPQQETSSTPPVTVAAPAPPAVVAASENRVAPAPVVQVLGARGTVRQRVAAGARMQGPRRCVTRPFRQVLRGQGIKRVTLYVNGRKVRTFSGSRSTYAITIDPRKVRSGVLRVSARVEYVAASGKRAQTLRFTALRCAKQAVLPRFAG